MIQKQLPGIEPVYIVYDNRDRVILTQAGNQRMTINGVKDRKWSFTKYDAFNRPIMTGIYVHDDDDDQVQMSSNISTTNFFENYNGATTNHGYTNNVFPTLRLTALTVSYYDNYSFILPLIYNNVPTTTTFDYLNSEITGQETNAFALVKGQLTGQKVNILGSSNYLWSVNYYDNKYHPIQIIASNNQGGIDRTTHLYDFPGKVLQTKTVHTGIKNATVNRRFVYDHAGRLRQLYHKVDAGTEILLAENKYNELGQLVEKGIGVNAGMPVQSIDYRYNIRGWLSNINQSDLGNDNGTRNNDTNDLFGMEILYNQTTY
jgi:hypothetical protein